MEDKMLCGSSCVKYIIENITNQSVSIRPDMIWITDLALTLKEELSHSIEVRCFHSKLYMDYKKMKNDSFDGFRSIHDYLKHNGLLIEKELTEDVLKNEIEESIYMIVCVESKILNHDPNMEGGHFIIIEKNYHTIRMINPLKVGYEIKEVSYDFILKMCCNYGSWRILIR